MVQSREEAIVREIGAGSRFAKVPLARIEVEMKGVEARIAEIGCRPTSLKTSCDRGDSLMALAIYWNSGDGYR